MVKDPRFYSHWSLKDNRFMYLTSLFLTKWKLVNKWRLPWYHHSLYTGQRRYILLLNYPEILELGTGTCKASASSMLREGDWSHVQDTTSPGFRPNARRREQSRFSSCWYSTTGISWVHKDIILRQVKRTRTWKFEKEKNI